MPTRKEMEQRGHHRATENTTLPIGCKDAKKARGKDKEAPTEMNCLKEHIGTFLQAQADTEVRTDETMELQSRLSVQKVEANRLAYEAINERTVAKLSEKQPNLLKSSERR